MTKHAVKVSIVGTGLVGSTIAYTLTVKGTASDIVLIDVDKERAEGEAMDITRRRRGNGHRARFTVLPRVNNPCRLI